MNADFETHNLKASSVAATKRKVRPASDSAPKPEKIRTELNIERWPAMWQPSKSKTKAAVRTMEREITMPDGSRGVSKLEVGFTQFGTITTEDQRMLYALVKQWEDTGKSGSQVFFSDRLLGRLRRRIRLQFEAGENDAEE